MTAGYVFHISIVLLAMYAQRISLKAFLINRNQKKHGNHYLHEQLVTYDLWLRTVLSDPFSTRVTIGLSETSLSWQIFRRTGPMKMKIRRMLDRPPLNWLRNQMRTYSKSIRCRMSLHELTWKENKTYYVLCIYSSTYHSIQTAVLSQE